MKYNKKEIMKNAWWRFNNKRNATFGEALSAAWTAAKNEVKLQLAVLAAKEADLQKGVKEMSYADYKNNFAGCKTINGTYDKKTKTIKVQIWELY